ncbi:MAG: NAD-dependent protein deacetylase, family [Actinomycetia bacterium]|nr:NAD-dependent protein deacetylase, family [Actinomycetes bacterium]
MLDDEGEDLAAALGSARHVVILTGAGISTESGIPDFRGPNGVWTKDPGAEKTASLEHYLGDRDVRVRAWQTRLSSPMWQAEPNAGHRALVDLEALVAFDLLVTQNIDGLHLQAGTSPDKLVEIHGTVHEAECLDCGFRGPMHETLARVEAGEADPACLGCGGILKSATISFGQNLVEADLLRAQRAALASDVFLALGSSLGVYPAAALPEIAVRNGARLAVLNAQPTPFDGIAHWISRRPLGHVLPELVDRMGARVGNNRPLH